MYDPIVKGHFGDVMEIRDGKFYIDSESKATQKRLLMQVNDNVHKNMERFSVALFDDDLRWKKKEFTPQEAEQLVDKLVELPLKKQQEMLFHATDRILVAHRNLKLVLFLTSGPFFALFFLFKYTIKFGVLYFLYKNKTQQNAETKQP